MRDAPSYFRSSFSGARARGRKVAVAVGTGLMLAFLAHGQEWQFGFDAGGNLFSESAENIAAPRILAQPQRQVVQPGELASFFVVVADARAVSYQWQFNGASITGATGDSLLLTNVSSTNEGQYTVVINGSGSVTSAPAALMIDSRGVGMPDSWQLTYFGNLNQTPDGDFDGDGISNLQEFLDGTNPADRTSALYQLTILSEGGSVTVNPASVSYTNGETVTLTAIASPSNTFRIWTGDAYSQSNPLSLVMNSNKTVRAVFNSAPMPSGVISWWRAENNAVDALGLNNGVLMNGATFAAGKVGTAFSFNGANQYVAVPDSPSLHPSSFTLECWAVFTTTNNFRQLMGKPLGSGIFDSFALWYNDGVLYGVDANTVYAGISVGSPFWPVPGQWYHFAYTFDATTLLQTLYVNGTVVGSNFGDRAPAYDSHPVQIGADNDNGTVDGFFAGEIDEAAIYGRALSASEIAAIYQADIAGKSTATPCFVSPSPFPNAVPGIAYTQQVSTAFGAAPISFSISAGSLPAGLALSSNGIISGIPGASGSNTFEITVTDAAGVTAAQTYGLLVLQPVAPAGLAGWWRAESNTLDSVGSNNGGWVGSAAYGTGEVGKAFSLNGSSSYVSVPDAPGLRPGSVTLEAWVLFTDNTSFHPIMGKPVGSGILDSYFLWFNGGTLNGSVCDLLGGGPTLTYTFTPVLGQWYHVAYTLDNATLQQALYLNGVVVASGTSSRAPGYDTHPVMIGSDNDNGSQSGFFAGKIDEATLYSRALGAAEISAIYNAGPAGKSTTGPYLNTAPQLPAGVLGSPYAQQLTSLFGASPVGFQLTDDNYPPGLSLSPSGLLSGIPTAAGTYNFNILATDASASSNDQVFSLQIYAPTLPAADIISWWRGESNALDSIGTNNGTLVGGVTFAPGKAGQSFALDGSTGYVSVPDSPSLQPASLTLEAWVMFYSASGEQGVFGKPLGSATGDSFQLFLNNGVLEGGISDTSTTGAIITYPFIPVTGRWYHLAFTFDEITTLESLYINGVQVSSAAADRYIGYDTHPVFIGADNDNGANVLFFNGRIDEAAIYGRALGSNEIASIYNAGPAGRTTAGPYFTNAPALADGYNGVAYNQSLGTTRGTPPVTCALVGGSLPDGLSLSSAGLISGTPTNSGSFNFTVQATDNATSSADQNFSIQIYARVASPPGIISWWRAENNALDAVGTNDGVLTNGGTYAAGEVGQSFLLDGIDDCVVIPDSPSLRPASVTMEAWVKIFSTNGTVLIFAKPLGSGSLDSYGLAIINGAPLAAICDTNGFGTFISSPYPLVTNHWYHLAYSFDNTTQQEVLYVNGVAVASANTGKSMSFDTHPLLLGADIENGVPSYFLNGQIDEASLYNRALGANEIASIYNVGSAGKQLLFANQLILHMQGITSATARLYWSTNYPLYHLEYNTNLVTTNWAASGLTPVVTGTNFVVTNSVFGARMYYRLSQ